MRQRIIAPFAEIGGAGRAKRAQDIKARTVVTHRLKRAAVRHVRITGLVMKHGYALAAGGIGLLGHAPLAEHIERSAKMRQRAGMSRWRMAASPSIRGHAHAPPEGADCRGCGRQAPPACAAPPQARRSPAAAGPIEQQAANPLPDTAKRQRKRLSPGWAAVSAPSVSEHSLK